MHKVTDQSHSEGYIRTGVREINEFTNNMPIQFGIGGRAISFRPKFTMRIDRSLDRGTL